METKQKASYMENLKSSLGYDRFHSVEPIGRSGGLALMWKSCYAVDILYSDNRIIDLKVQMGSISFFLSCVYGDPVRGRRKHVWEKLIDIGIFRDEAWVLVGDFNELMHNGEKLGGAVREESTFFDFRCMAETCKVREMRTTGNTLSWAGMRDHHWVQCQLDRTFGNEEWFRLFPQSSTDYMSMWPSDHRPLRIEFALEPETLQRGRFFFDRRMYGKRGVEEAIARGWDIENGNPNLSTLDRIARCRSELSKLKRTSDWNSKSRIERLQNDLDKESSKQFPILGLVRRLRQELAAAYREEEIFWRQKSREEWLRAGDRNTTYFHNVVKGKRIRNKILMLKDIFGNENFSEGSKGHIATEYFRDLFMSSNPNDLETLFEGFQSRVTPEMNLVLTRDISPEEIKQAAFSIKGSSAPGEDGLTGFFYQKYWHIVGPKMIDEVQGFFQSAILPLGWNHTQLFLLPKVVQPTEMKDMRPISLCSVQYKIISRILCERLKGVLPEIISDTQGAFVGGRLITDNVIIAHELVHGLRTNDKIGKESMAIKTDMSKAYDRVEWNFLEVLLEKLGFDRKWIVWIMSCITTVTFSVLLNGRSHGFIKPERGIRQGDPLSPFLFILCAEALVHVLNRAEAQGKLHGIRLAAGSPSVHHLLFADDSLLLCEASIRDSEEILKGLKLYGEASGQMINPLKSSIIFGKKIPSDLKNAIKEVLGIDKEGGEGSYLGLPECFQGSKMDLLNFIKEKLEGRLQGWYSKTLSMGAKEVLIKSVALALPIYAMSVFKLPKGLCERITSAVIEFWWSSGDKKRKISWVSWEKLCKPKEQGGMGFHDIGRFNQALLGKQAWRIWNNPGSLVSRILKGKYFRNGNFLECGMGTRPSYAWRSIMHGRELLKRGLFRQIGNGMDSNVWAENWIIDNIPRPPMYRDTSTPNLALKVSDLLMHGSNHWDVNLLNQTFTPQDVQRILLLRPSLTRDDSIKWGFTPSGVYSTRSGYKLTEALLDLEHPQGNPLSLIEKQLWRDLWKIKAPPKIKHFLWRALSGALAVKQRLNTRGIPIDPTCSICGQGVENICHALFTCAKARTIWDSSNFPIPSGGFSRNSMFLNFVHLIKASRSDAMDIHTRKVFPWLIWEIWKARNAFVFENKVLDASFIAKKAYEEESTWFDTFTGTQTEGHTDETTLVRWIKPPNGVLKCNVGSSWISLSQNSGASWILRDSNGCTIMHSRRAYSCMRSKTEADLWALFWAVECMHNLHFTNIIFETASESQRGALLCREDHLNLSHIRHSIVLLLTKFTSWSLDHVLPDRNEAAAAIALSVTRDLRNQSYIARAAPAWLHHLLALEAHPERNLIRPP